MDGFDNDVRVALYESFVASGRAPIAAEIAGSLDASVGEVEGALRRLHDAHVIVLAPGTPYVWMANPLSALPTPYEVEIGDRVFWGNCIWDALGIVAMLGSGGRVNNRCPDCGGTMQVEVRDDRLVSSDEGIVHYAVPAARWWDDIGFN
jgi:hypothetical protein